MTICIYSEPLTVFTSGTPMRGLFKELIRLRSNDNFKLIFRNSYPDFLKDYFSSLSELPNCEIVFEKYNRKISNLMALVGYKNYNKVNFNGDVYISAGTPDIMGTDKKKQIVFVADLSSIRTPENSSVKWHGNLIFRNSLKLAVKFALKIVCISNFTRNDLNNIYPEVFEKTEVVYDGIEDFWFDDRYEDFETLKINYSLKDRYWIWWGAVTKRKNLFSLLKAYQSLIKLGNELPNILIIGNFAPDQIVVKEFIKNELIDYVTHLPFQNVYTLKTLVKNSIGLLFPSYYEGFGLPVIEAFSQGKPVMHSEVTSLPEIAGGLGISCDPYSVESIQNALLKMIELKEDENEILKRKQWASKFTYKKAAEQFSKIIDGVVANK
jgi:glycosyltransferase involved in cell wall biosynthesis